MSSAGGVEPERHGAKHVALPRLRSRIVVEAAHREPLLTQEVEVDVGDRDLAGPGEALPFGQQHGILVDRGLTVPGEVGRRLARASGRVDIGRQAPRRGGLAMQAAAPGAADRDGAAAEVSQDGRARERQSRGRRRRHPHVLADLDAEPETRNVLGREDQVRAERRLECADRDASRPAARHLARNVASRRTRDSWEGSSSARPRAPPPDGSPRRCYRADGDGAEARRPREPGDGRGCRRDPMDRGLDRVEQRVLQQQVLDRIARKAEFREHREPDASAMAGGGRREDRLGIAGRIGDAGLDRSGRDPQEAVGIDRSEHHRNEPGLPPHRTPASPGRGERYTDRVKRRTIRFSDGDLKQITVVNGGRLRMKDPWLRPVRHRLEAPKPCCSMRQTGNPDRRASAWRSRSPAHNRRPSARGPASRAALSTNSAMICLPMTWPILLMASTIERSTLSFSRFLTKPPSILRKSTGRCLR